MSKTKVDKKFRKLGYKIFEKDNNHITYQKIEPSLNKLDEGFKHFIEITFDSDKESLVCSYVPGDIYNTDVIIPLKITFDSDKESLACSYVPGDIYNTDVIIPLKYSELKLIIKKIKEMKKKLSKMEEK